MYGNWKIKNDEIFYTEFRNLKIKIVSPKIEISRFFEYGNEEEIIEELIELSNPNLSQETIFVFPEGALAGVNFEKLKSFKNLFLTKFSKNHTIIMGINTEKNNQIFLQHPRTAHLAMWNLQQEWLVHMDLLGKELTLFELLF